jgi:thermostable 8-oxoguanine DNA glycosylase
MKGIYQRMLNSAQNAYMKASVIGKAIGGVGNLGKVLFNFNSKKVLNEYGSDVKRLLDDIEIKLAPHGKVRRKKNSICPKFCQTILSAATFIIKFESATDFYSWVDSLYNDEKTRVALPMIIHNEVDGIGFALACDFLKELGYVDFGRPDSHIKQIFKDLNLCERKANDYHAHQAILRIARNVQITPYNVDKLFWLIGTGNFYDDKHVGKKGKIGSLQKGFCSYAKKCLV